MSTSASPAIGDLYPDVAVPENAGRWITSVQHKCHRSAAQSAGQISQVNAHGERTVGGKRS
jgi:hypothetical protein